MDWILINLRRIQAKAIKVFYMPDKIYSPPLCFVSRAIFKVLTLLKFSGSKQMKK